MYILLVICLFTTYLHIQFLKYDVLTFLYIQLINKQMLITTHLTTSIDKIFTNSRNKA